MIETRDQVEDELKVKVEVEDEVKVKVEIEVKVEVQVEVGMEAATTTRTVSGAEWRGHGKADTDEPAQRT